MHILPDLEHLQEKYENEPGMVIGRIHKSMLLVMAGAFLCSSLPAPGQTGQQIAELDRLLSNLPHAQTQVGACFMRLPDGEIIYEKQAKQLLIPASNQKIITCAVALDVLGSNYTFDTHLALDGEDLILIGSGDPAMGDPRLAKDDGQESLTVFNQWANALKESGLTVIRGDIIIDDGVFDRQWAHPSWDEEDLQKWYAAPVGGLNFNDNCIEVTVRPTQLGQPVGYDIYPPTDWIEIINHCMTGQKNKPWIRRRGNQPIYELRGQAQKRALLESVTVTDPGIFTGEVFRKVLLSQGIQVAGLVRRIKKEEIELSRRKLIATHRTPFSQVVMRSLRDSQNLFAECLMKSIGQTVLAADQPRPRNWQEGSVAALLKLKSWGIDTTGMMIADGSGLSRDNRVSARQLVEVLNHMYLDRQKGQTFIESLPLNAASGTLRKRMKDIPNHVWAKTGYMRGIRPLSGYIISEDKQWYAFSVIFNNIPGGTAPYNKIHDELCRVLVKSP